MRCHLASEAREQAEGFAILLGCPLSNHGLFADSPEESATESESIWAGLAANAHGAIDANASRGLRARLL
jgi:hypothetical protein